MAIAPVWRAFFQLLRQERVDVIFGNPGVGELPLMGVLAIKAAPRYAQGL